MNDKIIEEAAENYCKDTYVRPVDEKGLKSYEVGSNAMPGYNNYSKRAKKHFIAGVKWHKEQHFLNVAPTEIKHPTFMEKLRLLFQF